MLVVLVLASFLDFLSFFVDFLVAIGCPPDQISPVGAVA
jgi:hypothetical protein